MATAARRAKRAVPPPEAVEGERSRDHWSGLGRQRPERSQRAATGRRCGCVSLSQRRWPPPTTDRRWRRTFGTVCSDRSRGRRIWGRITLNGAMLWRTRRGPPSSDGRVPLRPQRRGRPTNRTRRATSPTITATGRRSWDRWWSRRPWLASCTLNRCVPSRAEAAGCLALQASSLTWPLHALLAQYVVVRTGIAGGRRFAGALRLDVRCACPPTRGPAP